MIMKYLKEMAKENTTDKPSPPDWTSNRNSSLKAWLCAEEMKLEKLKYIKNHNKVTDYITKNKYQIRGADIAKALNINRSSLMNTSKYSPYFVEYLESINFFLNEKKENKLKAAKAKSSRGTIRTNKDELASINSKLRKRIAELERQNTEELVARTFDQLPLPIKRKLGID